jgi:putative tricarboxylic transport membrane protein
MTEGSQGPAQDPSAGRAAFRQKSAELFVAALFFIAGAIVVYDSQHLGAKWADDGPQAGYFPFYIGLILCISALINLAAALVDKGDSGKAFVEVGQLKLVLSVLVPTSIYVALIGWLGIYVASILYIGLFMRWLGEYAWWKLAAVSVGNSVFFFLIFEVWFKIPLPKGPLEAWMGLN